MHVTLRLPRWLAAFEREWAGRRRTAASQMELVLALTRHQVEAGTGGPFGAAVFACRDGRLLACGVNRVVPAACSAAHAEIMALTLAQQRAGHYDLGAAVAGGCVLVSSAEPCAMCMGAIPWAGIRRLVCGARDADARAAGFDEGVKPRRWVAAYRRRGIEVRRDVRRAEARALLLAYARAGQPIYNAAPAG